MVQDGFLQRPLADIVVQWSTGLTQEQRQPLPVPEHVADGAAQRRIGLGQPLVQLPRQPLVQLLRRRPARFLMPLQPRPGRELALPSKPSRSSNLPKPECASESPLRLTPSRSPCRRRAVGHRMILYAIHCRCHVSGIRPTSEPPFVGPLDPNESPAERQRLSFRRLRKRTGPRDRRAGRLCTIR